MFKPNKTAAKSPALAPFIDVADKGVEDWLEKQRCVNDTTKSAYLAVCIVLAQAADSGADQTLKDSCQLMFVGTCYDVLESPAGIIANEASLEQIVTRADKQRSSATQWIVDLVTASQKKPLRAENVEGYYANLGRSDVRGQSIADLMNNACCFLEDKIKESPFRENLTKNEFMSYHTSRVSTGKLLYEIKEVFEDLKICSDNDIRIIQSSADAPYDVSLSKKIPVKLVGYAMLYFEVTGKDVGKWYQGEKALSEVPTIRIRKIKEIFAEYIDLKNKTGSLKELEDVAGLRDAIGQDFF
jgi:hypothetical protein